MLIKAEYKCSSCKHRHKKLSENPCKECDDIFDTTSGKHSYEWDGHTETNEILFKPTNKSRMKKSLEIFEKLLEEHEGIF